MSQYGFEVGSSVFHVKDVGGDAGIVTEIDNEFDLGDVTTCRVVWGAVDLADALATPKEDRDIQWTNKLVPVTAEAGANA